MPVTFFNPAAPDGLLDEMWGVQSANPSISRERAQALKSDGDEGASFLYGEKETRTINAKCMEGAADQLVLPKVGTILQEGTGDTAKFWHVDSVTLTYSATDWPTLEVQIHRHAEGNSHAISSSAGNHRTYSFPANVLATLKGGKGVPQGAAGLSFSDLSVGISQLSLALTANHVEAPYVGEPPHIPASDNHDGTLTVTCETVGQATPTVAQGFDYDQTETSANTSNTANDDASHTYVMHLAHD